MASISVWDHAPLAENPQACRRAAHAMARHTMGPGLCPTWRHQRQFDDAEALAIIA